MVKPTQFMHIANSILKFSRENQQIFLYFTHTMLAKSLQSVLALTTTAVQIPSTDHGATNSSCPKYPDWRGNYSGTFTEMQVTTEVRAAGANNYTFNVTAVRGLLPNETIPTGEVMSGVCVPGLDQTILFCDANLPGSLASVQGNKTATQCNDQNQVSQIVWHTFSSDPNAIVNGMGVNDTGVDHRVSTLSADGESTTDDFNSEWMNCTNHPVWEGKYSGDYDGYTSTTTEFVHTGNYTYNFTVKSVAGLYSEFGGDSDSASIVNGTCNPITSDNSTLLICDSTVLADVDGRKDVIVPAQFNHTAKWCNGAASPSGIGSSGYTKPLVIWWKDVTSVPNATIHGMPVNDEGTYHQLSEASW